MIRVFILNTFSDFSDLSGSQWLTKDDLQLKLVEDIADIEYNNFVNAMDRLVALPYSYKCKEFILEYRKPLMAQTNMYDVLKPQFDETGRQFVTTYGELCILMRVNRHSLNTCSYLNHIYWLCSHISKISCLYDYLNFKLNCFAECLRKRARADVTIRSPGTGKVLINGHDLNYFNDVQPKEQVSN